MRNWWRNPDIDIREIERQISQGDVSLIPMYLRVSNRYGNPVRDIVFPHDLNHLISVFEERQIIDIEELSETQIMRDYNFRHNLESFRSSRNFEIGSAITSLTFDYGTRSEFLTIPPPPPEPLAIGLPSDEELLRRIRDMGETPAYLSVLQEKIMNQLTNVERTRYQRELDAWGDSYPRHVILSPVIYEYFGKNTVVVNIDISADALDLGYRTIRKATASICVYFNYVDPLNIVLGNAISIGDGSARLRDLASNLIVSEFEPTHQIEEWTPGNTTISFGTQIANSRCPNFDRVIGGWRRF